MMNSNIQDSILGCIFAGAIGDAMGQPFEGKPSPVEFHEYLPWSITDDTQLTLATCESIIKKGSISPEHIAYELLTWYRKRKITGVGACTLKALRDLDVGGHWALSGTKGEMSAGNGAAMRIAPLAFFLNPTDNNDCRLIRDVCRITHHNEEAYMGSLAIISAIHTSSVEVLFSNLINNLPDSRIRDRIIEIDHLPKNLSIGDIASRFGASGYVVESVPLALYAACQIPKSSLKEIIKSIIEVGGDTDTIASMAGNIIGAWVGLSEIDNSLVQLLPNVDQLKKTGNDLYMLLK